MLRGARGAGKGPRLDRMAGLVLAMLAGLLVPVAAVLAVAARQPIPRDCASGPASYTTVEGALLYSNGQDLWYTEGSPGHPRKLVDYAPPRARTAPAARSASASPSATATSPVPASPSPKPPPGPRVIAADISNDRKVVVFLLLDPPQHEGSISLMTVSPLDPPGTAPVEKWSGNPVPGAESAFEVRILDNGVFLLLAPLTGTIPTRPAPSPKPSPSPGASSSPTPSPSGTASTAPSRSPGPSSPPASPTPRAVLVIAPSPQPTLDAIGPEDYYISEGHSAWPDTRKLHPPSSSPRLLDRVDGPVSAVAGRIEVDLGTPLLRRRLSEIAVGHVGDDRAPAVCTAPAPTRPTAFSPDESELVLWDGDSSLLLDLSGAHGATRMLSGRVLAWRS